MVAKINIDGFEEVQTISPKYSEGKEQTKQFKCCLKNKTENSNVSN